MNRQIRVWGFGAATTAAFLGLHVGLVAAVRGQVRDVLEPGPASLDEVIGMVAAAVALLIGAWLAVSSTAAVLAHAPGRLGAAAERLAAAWAPLLTRRVAAALVGAAVGGALGPATAQAQEAGPFPGFSASAGADDRVPAPAWSVPPPLAAPPPPSAGSAAGTSPIGSPPERAVAGSRPVADPAPAPGWTPTRPVQRPVPAPDLVTSGSPARGGNEVVVHRGDTLWDLVAAHLGPDASDADIATAWPRWHAANRDVIGDDPDRLLPGQVLQVPSSAVAR